MDAIRDVLTVAALRGGLTALCNPTAFGQTLPRSAHMRLGDLSVEIFGCVLREKGAAEGLRFLNERVPHRYTSVCRFDGKTIKSFWLYDRDAALASCGVAELDLGRGFCPFVPREASASSGRSSEGPQWLPSREAQAVPYHCVPLVDDGGALFGSLCHFDADPRELSDGEYEFLQRAAIAIAPYLQPRAEAFRRAPGSEALEYRSQSFQGNGL